VATIIRARDEQDALRIANEAGAGRPGAVFTADPERGVRFALSLNGGMTHVNDSPVSDDSTTSLGGQRAIEEFTIERWVSVSRPWPDRPS
jgi:aldehyde dehydrogenase (NAD+)